MQMRVDKLRETLKLLQPVIIKKTALPVTKNILLKDGKAVATDLEATVILHFEGLGISGLTFKPFAKVKVSNSFMRLHVSLGDALKPVSKSQRRKAIRYGKPLPKTVRERIDDIYSSAVRHYLNR